MKIKNSSWLRGVLLPLAIGAYLFYFRVHGIADHFQLFGDQIRDWDIAGRAFWDLPLTGTPRVGGGYSFGPVFYWVLWLGRHVLGPFFENLPHAGGVTIALFFAVSAAMFYRALMSFMPLSFATAVVLFIGTSPWEASFSGTIWNPGLAVGFTILAASQCLRYWAFGKRRSAVFAMLCGWFAFQCHFPAVFFMLSVLAFLVVMEWASRGMRKAALAFALYGFLVAALQVPYLIFFLHSPPAGSTGVTESLIGVMHNQSAFHLLGAYRYLVQGAAFLVLDNADAAIRHSFFFVALPWVLGLIQVRRQPGWLFLSLLPIALAWTGYAVSQIAFDLYFQVTLIVPFSLALCLGIEALSARTRLPMLGLLVLILFWQPVRFAKSPVDRMPEYGTLVKGARTIAASGKAFRQVSASWADKRTDPMFLVGCLGKKPDPGGMLAVIDAAGNVEWRQ